MKTALSVMIALIAAPALAHDGVHLHPHGATGWVPVLLGLILIAGAGGAARTRVRAGADR